ncbi:NAD(P)H-hydrate epimerase [Demequina sp.]|uniref:NAD(P)H-hydrate epimerase n=1 Tax=Demequina sp. TaxID=2050685 RepID=UPI003D124FA3
MASQAQPLTAAELRQAERITMLSTPESVLMDRAAAAVAGEAHGTESVAVLVGAGNNGGDALLAGALLAGRGVPVSAVQLTPHVHPRGLERFTAEGGQLIEWVIDPIGAAAAIEAADTVIDGIVGLGGQGGLRPDAVAAVASIAPGTRVISVDLPSGLDPDSGDASAPHVTAETTVTFTAPKACLMLEPAKASAGRVVIADVGVTL